MKKTIAFIALGVAVAGLSSCNKKLSQFSSDFFSTNPTPLETVGENVPGTISGNIPAKFIVKNCKVTAVPQLRWNGGEANGQPVEFQGENVRANGQVVSYNNGGNVLIPFSVPY